MTVFSKKEELINFATNHGVDVVVHGCNARGKMNSGVAKAIRERWPEAYDYYMSHDKNLGGCQIVRLARSDSCVQYVVNAITQEYYGYDGAKYASYDAVDECMRKLADYFRKSAFTIAMPRIGCGRGGLEWTVVKEIIQHRLSNRMFTLYACHIEEPKK